MEFRILIDVGRRTDGSQEVVMSLFSPELEVTLLTSQNRSSIIK